MRRLDHGRWGGPVELFDIYEAWRDEKLACQESGFDPATGAALLEASPDSKADFASFLWEPVQHNFYSAYEMVASQWSKYVGITDVSSFDEVRIKGINGLTGIGYVGELGEYPGARRSFRPEAALVVDTYGTTYAMTRKLLRSQGADKLVQRNPQDLGVEASQFVTQLIVSMIVANPNAPDGVAMYHASRGNTVVAVLSEDAVVDAAVWLRTRRDPDNRPIVVSLRTAVVQNDRQALRLRQIVNSQLVGHTQNDPLDTKFTRGTMNPIADAGIIPSDGIIIDQFFPDANDVYFFADPDRLPAFTAGFLDGKREPMIGMADATVMHLSNSNGNGHDPYSFEADTIDYKVRLDVGVSAVDPLGTYRITPA